MFDRLTRAVAEHCGRPYAFIASVLIVVLWAVLGPLAGYSDTWQLVINTGTTVVTFWLVFIIQATQNRSELALHLKLDELLKAVQGARNELARAEERSEDEIRELRGD